MRAQNQVRTAGMAGVIVGLDLAVANGIATALGYDAGIVAELLPAAEAGMITALVEQSESESDG